VAAVHPATTTIPPPHARTYGGGGGGVNGPVGAAERR